ncbi:MFS transporter, partial [bacterium]|nr:MFS transporter [bacterium]
LTGERREGQYIGLWSISKKFAAAMGIGAGLSILGMVGYTPNVQQSAEVQMTLRVLYALVPALCNMVAIVIACAYPISGRIHAEIRKAIAQRQAGLPATNPLKPSQTLV